MEREWERNQIKNIINRSEIKNVRALTSMECSICMEMYEAVEIYGVVIKLPSCSHEHYFHSHCAERMLWTTGKCAICSHFYLIKHGNQPKSGTMRISKGPPCLEGYEDLGIGTIIINYSFPSGIQADDMPNPGEAYHGTHRTAYLPDDDEGNKILRLLQRCFDIRQTFCVGTSVTTGISNCVIWNGIHHKV